MQYHGEIGVSRPRERSTAGPVSYTCVGRSEGGREGGGGGRRRREEEEEGGLFKEEEGLFEADAVNEEDPEPRRNLKGRRSPQASASFLNAHAGVPATDTSR